MRTPGPVAIGLARARSNPYFEQGVQDMSRRTRDSHQSRDFVSAAAMKADSRQRIFGVMLTFVVAAILLHAAW
jgi:hypothetical protein